MKTMLNMMVFEMIFKSVKEIELIIRKSPNDALAIGRTVLANERTLLAFFRTGIGLLAGGIGVIKFVGHPLIVILGWIAVVFSIPVIFWGMWRFWSIRKLLYKISNEMADEEK